MLAQLCLLTFPKIRELGGFSCSSSQAIGQGLSSLIMGCDLFIALVLGSRNKMKVLLIEDPKVGRKNDSHHVP